MQSAKPSENQIKPVVYCTGRFEMLDWYPNVALFDDLMALSDTVTQENFIVIVADEKEQDEILIKLRSQNATALSLIFVLQNSPLSDFLGNGLWQESYQVQFEQYRLKRSQINLNSEDEISHKLLSYLWLHGCDLKARSVPFEKYLYDYPLLTVWGVNITESFSWLTSLKRKGWLNCDKLVNRVRFCANCASGHLNYVDNCPQCASIDIEAQSSLHCFNCGHIDKKDNFKNLSVLNCPNCLQDLRHIGVDYDRPIENQHCNDCDRLFVDANVQAECLHCHHINPLDDLHVRNIYSYQLADAGRNLVRMGISQLLFELSPGESLSRSQISWLIQWQNKLAIRHQHSNLIVLIEILNFDSVIKEAGEVNAFAQLDALKERLKSVVRVTDVSSNLSQSQLLLFLPNTDIEKIKPVYLKLKEKKALQSDVQIDIQIKAVNLPDENMGDDAVEWVIDKLATIPAL